MIFGTIAQMRAVLVAAAVALVASPAAAQPPTAATVLESRAEVATDAGQYAAAIRDANAAAAMRAAMGDERGRGRALTQAGFAQVQSGDYRAGKTTLTTSLALASTAGDDEGRALAITNLGNLDFFLGSYAEAAEYYDSALAIADARRSEAWASRWRRVILVDKATLDLRLGRHQEALAWFRQAEAGPDLRPGLQGQILMNLGVLYRRLGDPVKALEEYDAALAVFSHQHQVQFELSVMKNRGIVLALDLGRLEEARANFSDGLDRATRLGNKREMLQAHLYRGETELRLDLLDPARQDFTSSLEAAREMRTPEEEWKARYGLARTELRGGNAAAARMHLERAVQVIESIREAITVPTLKSDYFTISGMSTTPSSASSCRPAIRSGSSH